MAFVAEDGTGLADANSGASVAEADTYFTERAIAEWTGEESVKESALIRATDYVEIRWAEKFKGDREFPDVQALSFPRLDVYGDSIGVPTGYKRALYEYALRALAGPLAPDPTVTASGVALLSESHKTGPIEDSYRYSSKGAGSTVLKYRPYPTADGLIRPYLKSNGGVIR